MLAWRGKGRDDLLTALRRLTGGGAAAESSRPVIDVADKPLADCTAGFWSAPLSAARLRALPPAAAAPADLLLRSFEPPFVTAGGLDLATLLRPAYLLLAGEAAGGRDDAAGSGDAAGSSAQPAAGGAGGRGTGGRTPGGGTRRPRSPARNPAAAT
jgi:hypothetical protein